MRELVRENRSRLVDGESRQQRIADYQVVAVPAERPESWNLRHRGVVGIGDEHLVHTRCADGATDLLHLVEEARRVRSRQPHPDRAVDSDPHRPCGDDQHADEGEASAPEERHSAAGCCEPGRESAPSDHEPDDEGKKPVASQGEHERARRVRARTMHSETLEAAFEVDVA